MAGRSLKASETGVETARIALTNKAWSQEELAEQVDIGRQTANKFFARKAIGVKNFVKICHVLEVDWHEIADLPEEAKMVSKQIELCENSEIDILVQQVRNKVRLAIQDKCGTIRVLDMVQPVDLNDIYTDVNVLEKISGRRRIELSELLSKLQNSKKGKPSEIPFVQKSSSSTVTISHQHNSQLEQASFSNKDDINGQPESQKERLSALEQDDTLKIISVSPYLGNYKKKYSELIAETNSSSSIERSALLKHYYNIYGFGEPGQGKSFFAQALFSSAFLTSDGLRQEQEGQDDFETEESDDIERFGLGSITEERVSAKDVVERYPRLMLLGKPGAGKTTFLKYLAIQCINGLLLSKKIPIFITLKDFAEAVNKVSISDCIQNFFLNCGIERDEYLELLKHGRLLVLFDGLDEVREEDGERITNELKEFSSKFFYSTEFGYDSQKYPDKSLSELCKEFPNKVYTNSFIVTCRLAANEYTFENFTEVEVADFDDAQIAKFASNWFNTRDPKRLDRFLQKLNNNKPIKELGNNPLLLTLLCLVFEDSGDFPRNRAELYKEGLDIMLKKWDAKRNIQRNQVYKNLSLKRKEDLLSQIALTTFEQKDYFFRKEDTEQYISNYISNLPDAQTEPQALLVDSEAILNSIESQHGLLVERAKGIYSFSHLTFQEYFCARKITTISEPQKLEEALQSLASHVAEKRWREVFLLAVGMLPSVDRLLVLMKEQLDKIAVNEEKILEFLTWVNRKSSAIETNHKLFEIRDFYIRLDSALNFGEGLISSSNEQNLWTTLVEELIETPSESLSVYPIKLDAPGCILDNALTASLNHAIKLAYANEPSFDIGSNLIEALDLSIESTENRYLRSTLRSFKKKVPDPYANRSGFQGLWKNTGKSWVKQLRGLLKKYRDIANVWKFNEREKRILKRYYDANKFLKECLKDSYVTRAVRMDIENNLLNPNYYTK